MGVYAGRGGPAGVGWPTGPAGWLAGSVGPGVWGVSSFFYSLFLYFISFLLFIPFGFIKLLIYFNFEECENNT